MAGGGGWGGPVVFPHPDDDDDAGRLLDDVGSTNANDNDSNDTPAPPPPKSGNAPRGEGGRDNNSAGRQCDGGGNQGCGRDKRGKSDEHDRSSGSARAAADNMCGCLSRLIVGSGRVMAEG